MGLPAKYSASKVQQNAGVTAGTLQLEIELKVFKLLNKCPNMKTVQNKVKKTRIHPKQSKRAGKLQHNHTALFALVHTDITSRQ